MPSSVFTVSRVVVALFLLTLTWALFGKVDIIAEAPGKLIPTSYLKIVQPADAGVVTAILVSEGDEVKAGQTLLKLDPVLNEADRHAAEASLQQAEMSLRRVRAELGLAPLMRQPADPEDLYRATALQLATRQRVYRETLAQEKAALGKLQRDRAATLKTGDFLRKEVPTYAEADTAYQQLTQEGLVGKLAGLEKRRDRLEKEKELEAAVSQSASLQASIEQQQGRLAAVTSEYQKALWQEEVDVTEKLTRLRADVAKFAHKADFLALKAPQDGIVKDLAIRSKGAVVAPGTVLLTLVPKADPLQAEVVVKNEDVGFIYPTQAAQVKVAALPFQKYGLVPATVGLVTADAAESKGPAGEGAEPVGSNLNGYRTLVKLKAQALTRDGKVYRLKPGMQVVAEVNLGTQTVMEYLLSPVKKTLHEAISER